MKTNEIIKALRCCGDDNCVECPLYDGFPDSAGCRSGIARAATDEIEKLTDRCARYAEELTALQEKTRWIPVTERLPGDNHESGHIRDMLCYVPPRDGCRQSGVYLGEIGHIEANDGSNNFWGLRTPESDWNLWGWAYFEEPVVTHWMSLPARPETE